MGEPVGTSITRFAYLHQRIGEAFVVLRHTDRRNDPGSAHAAWGWHPAPRVQSAGLWLRDCPKQAKALKHRWDRVIQGTGTPGWPHS